jgi:hypothetical protein
MSKTLDWPAIVALTRNELQHGFETFEAIDFSQHDAAVGELGDKLTELEKARLKELRRRIIRKAEFDLSYTERAIRAGLSPDGQARHSVPYNQMLLVLSRQAQRDQVAYDALARHATKMIADGRPLVPELRMFLIDVVQAKLTRPKRLRGNKIDTHLRNLVICWVIMEICERFDLTVTRNAESQAGDFSACDAVAEAMVALGRTPHSYVQIVRIWYSTDAN